MKSRFLVTSAFISALSACTFSEPRIRSEPILFFPGDPAPASSPTLALTFTEPPLHCVQRVGAVQKWVAAPFRSGSSTLDECVYETVNAEDLRNTLEKETDDKKRNETLSLMMTVANQNCNNFRARVFAFRTNAGTVSSTASTLLASGGAITALVSGPVGAGLAGGSAALQSTLGNINSQFFSNYGAGQLDQNITSSMKNKALCIQARMNAADSQPSPESTPGGSSQCPINAAYTVGERMADLQDYDATCSLEQAAVPTASPTPAAVM